MHSRSPVVTAKGKFKFEENRFKLCSTNIILVKSPNESHAMHVASLDKFGVSVLLIDLYKVYTSIFLVAYGMDLAVFLLTKKVFRLPD